MTSKRSSAEPYAALRKKRNVEAIIDTGFDGWLSLPPRLVALLGLPWRRRSRALMADGSESLFNIHEATVIWEKRRRRIVVDEVDTAPLIGMALLEEHELRAQIRAGGKVTIKPLRTPRGP